MQKSPVSRAIHVCDFGGFYGIKGLVSPMPVVRGPWRSFCPCKDHGSWVGSSKPGMIHARHLVAVLGFIGRSSHHLCSLHRTVSWRVALQTSVHRKQFCQRIERAASRMDQDHSRTPDGVMKSKSWTRSVTVRPVQSLIRGHIVQAVEH